MNMHLADVLNVMEQGLFERLTWDWEQMQHERIKLKSFVLVAMDWANLIKLTNRHNKIISFPLNM